MAEAWRSGSITAVFDTYLQETTAGKVHTKINSAQTAAQTIVLDTQQIEFRIQYI